MIKILGIQKGTSKKGSDYTILHVESDDNPNVDGSEVFTVFVGNIPTIGGQIGVGSIIDIRYNRSGYAQQIEVLA